MSLRPLQDQLLVEFEAKPEMNGSLYVPATAEGAPIKARVLAVGPGKRLASGNFDTLDIAVGETILVYKRNCIEIAGEGWLVAAVSVLGVVG